MVFDDTEPVFDKSCFQKCDWSVYYPGACEAVPPDAPDVRGQSVLRSYFVDTDQAACGVTRRSHHIGVLILSTGHLSFGIQNGRILLKPLLLDWSSLLQRLQWKWLKDCIIKYK